MRRAIIGWAIVFGLFAASFVTVVAALNASVFGPGGYVHAYLSALARHDAGGALELAGVTASHADLLLNSAALGELDDIRQLQDEEISPGVHRVVFEYRFGEDLEQSTFLVEHSGMRFGLFNDWKFERRPLATLAAMPKNDTRFNVNGLEIVAEEQAPVGYRALVPGRYVFGHDTEYLTAEPVVVDAVVVGETIDLTVDVQANERFVNQVQAELDRYLDECATQEVLQPTGCPFAKRVTDRVVSTPDWSIAEYPEVSLVPGPDPGTWLMPRTDAAAHLVVDIRSIFDGSVTTFDEDIPFDLSYIITFQADGGLYIKERD